MTQLRAPYNADTTVAVLPFQRRPEGDEIVIGDPSRGAFLALPKDGVDLLDWLAAGDTVGEAARRYESRYHETPDMEDFLAVMTTEGFIEGFIAGDRPREEPHHHGPKGRRLRKVSLDWISPAVARRLTSAPVLAACLLLIGGATAIMLADLSLFPSTDVLLYPHGNFAVLSLTVLALTLGATFLHELAHATVARAAGVPVTLGISNLMYVMVAQTDISGLRMASKGRLFLAFLAGSIVDLVSASLLVLTLFADRHGVIAMAPVGREFVGALLLSYVFRVFFQCFFYLRTDLYYLVSTALNCRNLMSDTETMLRNGVLRLIGKRAHVTDQSGISRRERTAIRTYSVFYIVGRGFAVMTLLTVFVPIMATVVTEFITWTSGGRSHLTPLDFALILVLMLGVYGVGVVMWVRGLIRGLVKFGRTVRA
ncbi:hypothetical protein AB0J72_20410 [Dactylosporangium sp. NPDC049742]|uniref:hypothetical protein n=1 Tax=Dactylosporangium sp. NPDC049742 TaxID=3154737 RepID=UPI003438DDFF